MSRWPRSSTSALFLSANLLIGFLPSTDFKPAADPAKVLGRVWSHGFGLANLALPDRPGVLIVEGCLRLLQNLCIDNWRFYGGSRLTFHSSAPTSVSSFSLAQEI